MAKRWEIKDDEYLVEYYDAAGGANMDRDLNRPKGASARRVAFLKACGAWSILKTKAADERRHIRTYYDAIGNNTANRLFDELHDETAA